jgi:hypothetical protein
MAYDHTGLSGGHQPCPVATSRIVSTCQRSTLDRADDRERPRRRLVIRSGELIGRFRSLKAAKAEWDRVVASSGWSPGEPLVDADAAMRRESAERWARNRGG